MRVAANPAASRSASTLEARDPPRVPSCQTGARRGDNPAERYTRRGACASTAAAGAKAGSADGLRTPFGPLPRGRNRGSRPSRRTVTIPPRQRNTIAAIHLFSTLGQSPHRGGPGSWRATARRSISGGSNSATLHHRVDRPMFRTAATRSSGSAAEPSAQFRSRRRFRGRRSSGRVGDGDPGRKGSSGLRTDVVHES